MASEKVVIKKYGDRRLYDSAAKKYVNLEDIARLIREGAVVEVRDARSGKDLTRVTLTQIIVEDAREEKPGLPLNLLRQLIVASDKATHDFLSWYLDTAHELYNRAGSAIRSGVSEARSAVTSPVDYLRNLLGGDPRPSDRDAEIERLRERIRELETQLAERPKRRSKAASRV